MGYAATLFDDCGMNAQTKISSTTTTTKRIDNWHVIWASIFNIYKQLIFENVAAVG